MQDDRSLIEALRRALEPPPYEPTPEQIAALQRQLRRHRLQRPLRRAAVAAAAALIALMGAALAVQTDGHHEQRSADAVAITNTRAAADVDADRSDDRAVVDIHDIDTDVDIHDVDVDIHDDDNNDADDDPGNSDNDAGALAPVRPTVARETEKHSYST